MSLFYRWNYALARRQGRHRPARTVGIAALAIALFGSVTPSRAAGGKSGAESAGVDTEHLFGFTEGTDIGAAGEKELELDFDLSFRQERRFVLRHGIGIRVQIHRVPEFPYLGVSDIRLL